MQTGYRQTYVRSYKRQTKVNSFESSVSWRYYRKLLYELHEKHYSLNYKFSNFSFKQNVCLVKTVLKHWTFIFQYYNKKTSHVIHFIKIILVLKNTVSNYQMQCKAICRAPLIRNCIWNNISIDKDTHLAQALYERGTSQN